VTHVDPPDRADRQGYEIVKIQDGCGRLSEKKSKYTYPLSILSNETANIRKQIWNKFVLVVKTTALKNSKYQNFIRRFSAQKLAITSITGH